MKYFYKKINENELNDKDNYIFNGYISKINNQYIYKINPLESCYISKQIKFLPKKHPNFTIFISIRFLHQKNVQEYVFPKLLPSKEDKNKKEEGDSDKIHLSKIIFLVF